MLKRLIIYLTIIFSSLSHAEEVEIGGLLIDNTISRQGHEFAHHFSMLWQDIPNTHGINVQIVEQVVPRAGTRLLIKMSNRTIYVTNMGRRQSSIKKQVEQAVFILINAIAQSETDLSSPDMANDEF